MTAKTQPAAPTFRHDVTFCGVKLGTATCHRLPAHTPAARPGKGDDPAGHNAFVRGNGVTKPKARKAAKPKAVQTVTIEGKVFVVTFGKDGSATLSPIVTSAPKVTKVIPEAPSERMVADTTNGKLRTAKRQRRAPDTSRRVATVTAALGA